ncbi:TAP domain protein [Diplocarpon rosae]|nr:TAP domain protein [Diplocarpon rosae]
MARSLSLLLSLGIGLASASPVYWTPCGTNFDCTELDVPLEYGDLPDSAPREEARITLTRYNATVPSSERLGSLLVNPGGPGASGVKFVQSGAGAAISAMTDGRYDIIGWDPRGSATATPLLYCFQNAGMEMQYDHLFFSSPKILPRMIGDPEYEFEVRREFGDFDTDMATVAKMCVEQNSKGLFTSSAAYVARDMAAIVDAVDGKDALLNYWGFSYGSIYLAEFVQAFPERVGRVVVDGIVDPEANALSAESQLANDQVSVRDALDDFISMCEKAGQNCPLSIPPEGVSANLTQRLDDLFEKLYFNPVKEFNFEFEGVENVEPESEVGADILRYALWYYLRVPASWARVANAIADLEKGNSRPMIEAVGDLVRDIPRIPNTPTSGRISELPLTCVDNAPSGHITLDQVIELTRSLSIEQKTPLLLSGLKPVCFCRHFPDTRPLLPSAGVSRMSAADATLAKAKKTILILNPEHDPTTPLQSARKLRSLLPKSSRLAIRRGPGHTTPTLASLSLTETLRAFFVKGELPEHDEEFHAVDQDVFPAGSGKAAVAAPTFPGNHDELQTKLLQANYDLIIAFMAIGDDGTAWDEIDDADGAAADDDDLFTHYDNSGDEDGDLVSLASEELKKLDT